MKEPVMNHCCEKILKNGGLQQKVFCRARDNKPAYFLMVTLVPTPVN